MPVVFDDGGTIFASIEAGRTREASLGEVPLTTLNHDALNYDALTPDAVAASMKASWLDQRQTNGTVFSSATGDVIIARGTRAPNFG